MSKHGPLSDVSYQGKLRNREEMKERTRVRDLATIFGLPEGRRFVYDLVFNKAGIMDVYPGQDSGIYRHEGRRALGQQIAAELQEKFPDLWTQMIQEQLAEKANDAVIRDAAEAATKEDDNA